MKKLIVALIAGALALPVFAQTQPTQEQKQEEKTKKTRKKTEEKKKEETPKS